MRRWPLSSTTHSLFVVVLLSACGRTELLLDGAGGAGGSQNVAPCPDGTFDDGTTGGCVGFRVCSPGTYISVYGTPTSDRQCAPCPAGSYSADSNLSICRSHTLCELGEYVLQEGTATTNQFCGICPSGSYSALANAATCTPWSNCEPGTWVSGAGTATSDRECSACAAEAYSSGANAPNCTPRTVCSDGFVVASPGTPTSDRTCTEEWIREFGTAEVDYANAMDLDQDGNVYVAGYTAGVLPGETSLGEEDAFIEKYDLAGNEQLVLQFGSIEDDRAMALVVDGLTFVVAGTTRGALPNQTNAGLADAFVQKYDSSGSLLWSRQFGTSAEDNLASAAVDQVGNIYLMGLSTGSFSGGPSLPNQGAFLRKYSSNGDELFTREFAATGPVRWAAISENEAGEVYVGGSVDGDLPGAMGFGYVDAFVQRWDSAGNTLWTRQFDSTAYEAANAVTADLSGNVYVAGSVGGVLPGQTSGGGLDAFLRKYDVSGVEQWTRQFGAANIDDAAALDLDAYGNVIVSGATDDGTGAGLHDVFVRRYDAAGTELGTRLLGSTETDSSLSVAADSSAGVAVAGYTFGALPGQTYLGQGDAFVARLSL